MQQEYQITLHSQMGPREGVLSVAMADGQITGTLTLLGFANPVTGYRDEHGAVTLIHPLQTAVEKHACRSVFTQWGETLAGEVCLKGCRMLWTGARRTPEGQEEDSRG